MRKTSVSGLHIWVVGAFTAGAPRRGVPGILSTAVGLWQCHAPPRGVGYDNSRTVTLVILSPC